jgi:hypothetical protein
MLDRDLSELYQVPTKRLNEQVKRNIERFPEQFRLQLTQDEKNELVANCDRFENLKHSTSLPYAFTEQGVAMLSAVLRSDTAVKVSIQIMQAFVAMRRFIATNAEVFQRLVRVERKQLETDNKFEQLFDAIESKEIRPKQGVFFDGQVFDAYSFVADLIRTARKSIVLIDNYVDDSVLTLLSKRPAGVLCTIYTKTISKQLSLDLKKHNQQYSPINLETFPDAHDRFVIIDGNDIYHIGASLKDLGKKWFAFSKMDLGAVEMLGKPEILPKVKIDG